MYEFNPRADKSAMLEFESFAIKRQSIDDTSTRDWKLGQSERIGFIQESIDDDTTRDWKLGQFGIFAIRGQ